MQSARYTLANNFGSFTTVLILVNPNYLDCFKVRVTVRKALDLDRQALKMNEATYTADRYADFIADLHKRGAKLSKQQPTESI